ncbi:hypothetical protein [Lysinibacillus sp. LZ02]|uniref:hypothetical protein n=1 Tax=Lysinibacillus sp. LZ02 TaxID=3420668 RepID=UPI003D35F789
MDVKQLEAEIANLKSRLDDALAEVGIYNERNDYVRVAECGKRIIHLADQLHMRTVHLQDRINFYSLISDLKARGLAVEAVKRYAHQG